MSEDVINPMTNVRRELNLRILNDESEPEKLQAITQLLYFLDQHFPPKKLSKALIWLIENRIIGRTFLNWYDTQCKTHLEMHRILLGAVDNDVLRPVIAGQNFKI